MRKAHHNGKNLNLQLAYMKKASKKLAFYRCSVWKNIFFGGWLATFEKKFGLIITVISYVGSVLIFSVCCILGYIELVKEKRS